MSCSSVLRVYPQVLAINRSVVEDCQATGFGGGFFLRHVVARIQDSVIRGNTAESGGAGHIQGARGTQQSTRQSLPLATPR